MRRGWDDRHPGPGTRAVGCGSRHARAHSRSACGADRSWVLALVALRRLAVACCARDLYHCWLGAELRSILTSPTRCSGPLGHTQTTGSEPEISGTSPTQ